MQRSDTNQEKIKAIKSIDRQTETDGGRERGQGVTKAKNKKCKNQIERKINCCVSREQQVRLDIHKRISG